MYGLRAMVHVVYACMWLWKLCLRGSRQCMCGVHICGRVCMCVHSCRYACACGARTHAHIQVFTHTCAYAS